MLTYLPNVHTPACVPSVGSKLTSSFKAGVLKLAGSLVFILPEISINMRTSCLAGNDAGIDAETVAELAIDGETEVVSGSDDDAAAQEKHDTGGDPAPSDSKNESNGHTDNTQYNSALHRDNRNIGAALNGKGRTITKDELITGQNTGIF